MIKPSALLTLAAGCVVACAMLGCTPPPVSADEFNAFAGKPVEEVVARMGCAPDKDDRGRMHWDSRVRGSGGKLWKRAVLQYDPVTRRVSAAQVYDD